jgi:hypothetical protein
MGADSHIADSIAIVLLLVRNKGRPFPVLWSVNFYQNEASPPLSPARMGRQCDRRLPVFPKTQNLLIGGIGRAVEKGSSLRLHRFGINSNISRTR